MKQKLGLQKTKLQNKVDKLDRESKKQEDEPKISIFGKKIKRALYMFLISLITKVLLMLTMVAGIMALIGAALIAVIMIVMLLLEAFTIMMGGGGFDDWFGGGGSSNQEAGEHYSFNSQDYNLLSSMYLKNIYVQAWLLTNAKDALNSSASVPYMLGIVNYEYGPRFFKLYDSKYEDKYSVTEYYCGASNVSENTNGQGVYQWLLLNGSSSFYPGIYNELFNDSYTPEVVWGDIPHKATLNSAVIDEDGHSNLWSSYGCKGGLEHSPWNLAVSAGGCIANYEKYAVSCLEQDGMRGHNYKKYYEQACKRQGLDPKDDSVYNWVMSSIYYLVHAGGAWTNNMTQEIYDAWGYASFDYLVYSYRMYKDMSLCSSYQNLDSLKNLDVGKLKKSAFGNQVTHASSAGAKFNTAFTTDSEILFELNGKTLSKTLMQAWADSLPSSYSHYVTDFGKMYTYYSYDSDGNQIGSGNRQAAYAIAVAPTMSAIGNLKLNLIFKELGKEYVIDAYGYVCNPASDDSNSGGTGGNNEDVPGGGGEGGDFEATLKELGTKGNKYSNVRNSDWFATLNNSEWTNPLGSKDSGGFYLSSRWGWRYLDDGWDFHGGVDLAYYTKLARSKWKTNCPVYAMHSGTVTKIKDYYDSAGKYLTYEVKYSRNGTTVTRYITYMHLEDITVSLGDTIKKGQIVGHMGSSDGRYPQHLHMQIGLLDHPDGKTGLLDIETELPFVTQYDGYHAWDNTASSYSGYLNRKPNPNISSNQPDPNYYLSPS